MSGFLKNFEKFFKGFIKNFVFKLKSEVKPKLVLEYSDELAKATKILLLRQDRIGDLLISIPFIKNFKSKLPHKKIDILLSHRNVVAKSCVKDYVDNIYVFQKSLFARLGTLLSLRKEKYELVIDLFDNPSFTSSLIINFLKPQFALGFDKDNRNVYTHIVLLPDKMKFHIVERLCSLLVPFGINPDDIDKKLEFPIKVSKILPNGTKTKLGIIVAGSSKSKYWGLDKLISLIKQINFKYDFDIIVFGTKEYKKILQKLNEIENVYVAPITSNYDEFASMVSRCNYLITPDTSVVHLASAFKIPVVVFYTFVNEKFGMPWFPYGTKYKALISSKDNYSDITPRDVLDALSKLIEE